MSKLNHKILRKNWDSGQVPEIYYFSEPETEMKTAYLCLKSQKNKSNKLVRTVNNNI